MLINTWNDKVEQSITMALQDSQKVMAGLVGVMLDVGNSSIGGINPADPPPDEEVTPQYTARAITTLVVFIIVSE